MADLFCVAQREIYREGYEDCRKDVRLQREGLGAIVTTKAEWKAELAALLEDTVEYGTVGGELPGLFAYYGEKQMDLSGLTTREQVIDLMEMEVELLPEDEKIIVLAVK